MKQINSLIAVCFAFTFVAMLASCSKEGPAGAAGATGPAGPPGPAGAAGSNGSNGSNGTTTVIYSGWLNARYKADTFRTAGGVLDTAGFYYDTTGITKLTSAILTSGEIKVYINVNSSTNPIVFPLPYWDPYIPISINPKFATGEIYMYSNENVSTYISAGTTFQQWRFVLIPGSVGARYAIDWNNYAAVKKYLNLPD